MGYNSGRGPWRAHFKEKLATENDEAKRKLLLQLLAEEEQKLAAALRRKRGED
jgi:hypothetical protein